MLYSILTLTKKIKNLLYNNKIKNNKNLKVLCDSNSKKKNGSRGFNFCGELCIIF